MDPKLGDSSLLPIFLKIFGNMPMFWNSIISKLSFNEKLAWFKIELCPIKLKKKKKNCYELEFHLKRHYRALKRRYRASWTWYIKLIKKIAWKHHYRYGTRVLCYFYLFFLNLIRHNSILNQASFSLKLDFTKIEFWNRDTNLYSFKIGTYCQIFNTPPLPKKKN